MPIVLPLTAVRLDDACQPRAITDLNLAGEYAEAMLADGAVFPPVVVFHDGETYWLADGYHRWHAHDIAHLTTIDCDVRQGGKRDAILYSVGANAEHGWRRSNDDKRRAVQTLLNDPEWAQWSDREIGRRCGVDKETVGKRRPVSLAETASEVRTYRDKHGNTTTMRTAGINVGRQPEPAPEPDYPLNDDPRQLDIEDAAQQDAEEAWQSIQTEDPYEAPRFDYDRAGVRLCSEICALIEKMNGPYWPTTGDLFAAWAKFRGDGPSLAEVQRAADWMETFVRLFRAHEPARLEAVDAMLNRAKELTNGTH